MSMMDSSYPTDSQRPSASNGASGYRISVGLGKCNPKARLQFVPGINELAPRLMQISGVEAWWSPHTWKNSQRDGNVWEGASSVVLDIDYTDGDGKHALVPEPIASQLAQNAQNSRIPGTLFHGTPRGARVIFALKEPITKTTSYERAFAGAAALMDKALAELNLCAAQDHCNNTEGFEVDRGSADLARMFYAPRATVNGEARNGTVIVIGGTYGLAALDATASVSDDREDSPEEGAVDTTAAIESAFARAAARWNEDHRRDFGPSGQGACPACGHNGCFGRHPETDMRWVCHSTNHETDSGGCGRASDSVWTGDALDLEAHERCCSLSDVLRIGGYLRSVTGEHASETPQIEPSNETDVQPSRPTIQFLDWAQIAADGIPPIRWIIEPWIAEQDIILLVASPGSGKSTLAAYISRTISGGTAWLDGSQTSQGPVIYLDEEAGRDPIIQLFLRQGPIPAGLHVATGQGLRLDDAASVQRIENSISDIRPRLVVLDTMTPFLGEANENESREVGKLYRTLFRLRDKTGTSFLLLHHQRKAPPTGHFDALNLVRGSTAWTAQASAVWSATRHRGSGFLDLVVQKRRGGPEPKMRIHYDEEADRRITLRSLGVPQVSATSVDLAARVVLELLYANSAGMRRQAIIKEAGAHSAKTIDKALSLLRERGDIDKPSRGFYRAVVAAPTETG